MAPRKNYLTRLENICACFHFFLKLYLSLVWCARFPIVFYFWFMSGESNLSSSISCWRWWTLNFRTLVPPAGNTWITASVIEYIQTEGNAHWRPTIVSVLSHIISLCNSFFMLSHCQSSLMKAFMWNKNYIWFVIFLVWGITIMVAHWMNLQIISYIPWKWF